MKNFKHLLFLSILCSLLVFTNCGDSDDPVANDPAADIAIGDAYQGGIVFYIFKEGDLGYTAGEVHGIISSKIDQKWEGSDRIVWCSQENMISGADGTEVGTGLQNTLDILADCNSAGIAAKLTSDYELIENGVTYDDWFLPSKDEMDELYSNKDTIGGFSVYFYWSSTEVSSEKAWSINYTNGLPNERYSKKSTMLVRAVRYF